MMHNLEQLRLLSDEKLIEKVAREVMGWQKEMGGWWMAKDERGFPLSMHPWKDFLTPLEEKFFAWDPLTDWNQTMEVLDRIEALGFEWRVDGRPSLQRGCRIAPNGEFNSDGVHFVADDSAQRAICLAAILAISLASNGKK